VFDACEVFEACDLFEARDVFEACDVFEAFDVLCKVVNCTLNVNPNTRSKIPFVSLAFIAG
jgi:hypothetical protein